MTKQNLLIVEENETDREILNMLLDEDFNVDIVDDASKMLDAVSAKDYEIIVTEINFAKEDGLQLCKTIATDDALDPPAVVVVSEREDEQLIKQAFAAGIYDYFQKPFNVIVFHESVIRLAGLIAKNSKQKREKKATQSVLTNTMNQASFYGSGLEIVADLNRASTYERVAQKVLKNLASMDIYCAIQFRVGEQVHTYEWDNEHADDRVMRVFELLKHEGRIYRFGKRLMFNDEHTSLFVKQINDKDGTVYDSILDMGAKLVPAIEARVVSLMQHETLVSAQRNMNDILKKLELAIVNLAESKRVMMDNISTRISMSFHELDLTDEQEQFFTNMIEKEIKQHQDDSALSELSELLTNFNQILAAGIQDNQAQEDDDEPDYQELEFF